MTSPRTGWARQAAGAKATSQMIASRTAASPLPSSLLDRTQSPFQTITALPEIVEAAARTRGSLRRAACTRLAMSQISPPPPPPEPALAAPTS